MYQEKIRRSLERAYQEESFVLRWRRRRMERFVQSVGVPPGARIVDLGGDEALWQLIDHDYHVTLVNLPGRTTPVSDPKRFDRFEGDACDLSAAYPDQHFDVVFSNSVIEHVGEMDRWQAFASEARRLGRGYWIQTPHPLFPIEPHTGVPFYWHLPKWWRRRMNRRWERELPRFWQMIQRTDVLRRSEMEDLFPDGTTYIERKAGFPKSTVRFKPFCPAPQVVQKAPPVLPHRADALASPGNPSTEMASTR